MGSIRIETELTIPTAASKRVVREAQSYLGVGLVNIESRKCYWLEHESIGSEDLKEQIKNELSVVFYDSVMERYLLEKPTSEQSDNTTNTPPRETPQYVVEVGYRPGVTDNVAHSAEEALSLLGATNISVATGKLHFLFGELSAEDAEKIATALLGNPLIQRMDILDFDSWLSVDRFSNPVLPKVVLEPIENHYQTIDVSLTVDDLMELSTQNCWALSKEEIQHIQHHFNTPESESLRYQMGLPQNPTDVEIEIIAQSWSEHCKHKIFAATVDYTEGHIPDHYPALGDMTVESLFKTYVKQATIEIEKERELPWLRSVFHDNAGVVRFDENIDVAIKVETHNSPSALDPYGGAITGILGVNRDIIGVGMGARPVANMDVFCFADPKWPLAGDEVRMPVGLLQPRRLLEGVHKGVEDGGNTSGVPTVNGAIYFDQDYAGKPLVFVGTVGVMPHQLPDGTEGVRKEIAVGDKIFMVGGAIGADGIHGATFSSLELNENSPATAVQIGDPITQKRALDFIIEARDLGLFRCLTDNGAGGLSSSVGEMATLSNGAVIDLKRAPTKYPGLKPWELMISESQERMTLAVPPEQCEDFSNLAQRRGVMAANIGEFNSTGSLDVYYGESLVAALPLHFLHESLPSMKIPAHWAGPINRKSWIDRDDRQDFGASDLESILHKLLGCPNIASKETWVRQYDHEVQGATHIKPFGGKSTQGPNDAGVIWLYPHGGNTNGAVAIGCGLAPRVSLDDPYMMAQYAVDEAIRNVVATGGDIDTTCILDNFCWPDPVQSTKTPDGHLKMGQLVRCCKGLYDIAKVYGTPLVSGKDSMKNDFRGQNGRGEPLTISILPTLLVTAMSKAQIGATQTSDFKAPGHLIYQIGQTGNGLRASELSTFMYLKDKNDHLNRPNLEANLLCYRSVHDMLKLGLLSSVHDISDGGALCAVAESCFGNRLGANIQLEGDLIASAFSEAPGQFIISIEAHNKAAFVAKMTGVPFKYLGRVTDEKNLEIKHQDSGTVSIAITSLFESWSTEL